MQFALFYNKAGCVELNRAAAIHSFKRTGLEEKKGVKSKMAKDKMYGKTLRKNFARHEEIVEMPNLLALQKKSYQWFLDTGLREVFSDVASISNYAGNLELSFIDYKMDEAPKYDVLECKARDATYAAPLKVSVRLYNKETGELKAELAKDSEAIAFQNSYETKTSIGLEGTKSLSGRTLKDGEFTFEVKDKAGKVVATGSNKSDGSISFNNKLNYKLSDLEKQKAALEKDITALTKLLSENRVTERELKCAFSEIRRALTDGTLANAKRLVDTYIHDVVVYPNRIVVIFNLFPHIKITDRQSGSVTNMEESFSAPDMLTFRLSRDGEPEDTSGADILRRLRGDDDTSE